MTDKRIVHSVGPGDVCCVTVPAPKVILALMAGGMTEEEAVEHVASKDVPSGHQHFIADKTDLPDRTYRDAWVADHAAKSVSEEGSKVIEIHKARISDASKWKVRKLREQIEDAEDAGDEQELTRLTTLRKTTKEIVNTLGQEITRVVSAGGPDALKSHWPTELSEEDIRPSIVGKRP